ncbi:cytochrome P450 CYP94D108-like, partial [Prosopis cineraria]|uniref:cytochrome P450 CYP94D108-like n=1 Tax=Prosopis cineraria TaxID=364024 RepID=UPI0024109606
HISSKYPHVSRPVISRTRRHAALLLFAFFFLFFLYIYLRFLTSTPEIVKRGFNNYPFIGALPDFVKNRHRFLEWTTQVLRDCPTHTAFLARPGNVLDVLTANPHNVEYILKTNFHNYPKGQKMTSVLQDFLGSGIFNADGHLWKVQRKTASYEFNSKSLRNFVMDNVTVEIQTRLLPLLSRASQTRRVLDLQDILERFAFNNICKLAFNVDPGYLDGDGTTRADLMRAFDDATTLSTERFMYAFPLMFKIKKWLNVGSERRLRESVAVVHKLADEIIRSILEVKKSNQDQDLLSRFIGTEESSPEFLRDIVISFILAGRDTTSSGLSWFFWILSSRPDVKREIREELKAIRSKNGRNKGDGFGYQDLKDMHYLQAAISEAMRLYPPVPVDTRTCWSEEVLPDGTMIKKDWFITYHTYAMGRMESIWGKDCCEYKPERWIENGIYKGENPFRYPVFHAGPRLCLGKQLAYIQMKCVAASVLALYDIEARHKDECPQHLFCLTLRMKGGLPVAITQRDLDPN